MAANTPSASVALFVYGTLCDEALVRKLTGKSFPSMPAVLHGFQCITEDTPYPFIARAPGQQVQGILMRQVDEDSLACIDEYEDEGRLYIRTEVQVAVGPRTAPCVTYVGVEAEIRSSART